MGQRRSMGEGVAGPGIRRYERAWRQREGAAVAPLGCGDGGRDCARCRQLQTTRTSPSRCLLFWFWVTPPYPGLILHLHPHPIPGCRLLLGEPSNKVNLAGTCAARTSHQLEDSLRARVGYWPACGNRYFLANTFSGRVKTAIHTNNFLKGKFTVQMEFFTCTRNEMFGQGTEVHTGARRRALFIEWPSMSESTL